MNQAIKRNEPLKVAVLSSASGGGAGIAANRVTQALNLLPEINADFIDMKALGGRISSDAAPPGNMSNRRISDTHFTVEFPGYVRGWVIDLLRQYDVLNIHWASFLLGLAEIDELSRLGVPILFTCHDYHYFTGGCHYPATCRKLKQGCISCPQVDQEYCSTSVIVRNFRIKARILGRPNVYLSAPSRFLVNEALSAGLIPSNRTYVLRNPYFPVPGIVRSDRVSPPKLVLMADSMAERRKAMPLAIDALAVAYRKLGIKRNGAEPFIIEIIGDADSSCKDAVHRAGFPHIFRGRIANHAQIAQILANSNLLLTCSLEDNWPNVLVESATYGVIPIVGPGHGCEEFVKVFGVGVIAREYDIPSFVDALLSAMESYDSVKASKLANEVLKAHSPDQIGSQYCDVFKHILVSTNGKNQLTREVFSP